MKRFVQLTLVLSFFFISISLTNAQRRGGNVQYWEAGVFLGLGIYQGDLASSNFPVNEGSFALGFGARNYLSEILAVKGNLFFTRLNADEMGDHKNANRGLAFNTSLLEISGVLEYEPLGAKRQLKGGKKQFTVSPFIYAGFGMAFTNPQAAFPDGFGVGDFDPVEQDIKNGESKVRLTLPSGIGVKVDLGKKWIVQADIGARMPFTDYLDGISETANPDKGDWYWFGGITAFFNMR